MLVPPHADSTRPRGTKGPSASASRFPVNQHVALKRLAGSGEALLQRMCGGCARSARGVEAPGGVPTVNKRTQG